MSPDAAEMLPPRILVLDDERQIHASFRLRLGRSFDLAFCFNARDALEKIATERYDLCLVDVHMPQMDGLTFIAAARQADPGLGYVVVSAFDTDENLRRAIPLQVYDFLPKPLPERHEFEARIPEWVDLTRRRRRELALAHKAGTIVNQAESNRLEFEVELVASESARDALLQASGFLTTMHANVVTAIALLTPIAKAHPTLAQVLRNLEESRKTGEAAIGSAAGFFDSAYGNRDTSPALVNEGVTRAISIALRSSKAEELQKTVDFSLTDGCLPIRGISGIVFLSLMVQALWAALELAPPGTTVGIRGTHFSRLDSVTSDLRHRTHFWVNRKHALSSHPGILLTLSTAAKPLSRNQFEGWMNNTFPTLAAVPRYGLITGIEKCQGVLGLAQEPHSATFQLLLALPT